MTGKEVVFWLRNREASFKHHANVQGGRGGYQLARLIPPLYDASSLDAVMHAKVRQDEEREGVETAPAKPRQYDATFDDFHALCLGSAMERRDLRWP